MCAAADCAGDRPPSRLRWLHSGWWPRYCRTITRGSGRALDGLGQHMVIERALEKLRQSGAAKAGGVPYPANPAPALPAAAAERALAPERPVKPVRAPHAAPAHVRVSFPQVEYSR